MRNSVRRHDMRVTPMSRVQQPFLGWIGLNRVKLHMIQRKVEDEGWRSTGREGLSASVPFALPSMSWIQYSADCEFPIQNLPYGVFHLTTETSCKARCATTIGSFVVDLAVLAEAGLFEGTSLPEHCFSKVRMHFPSFLLSHHAESAMELNKSLTPTCTFPALFERLYGCWQVCLECSETHPYLVV